MAEAVAKQIDESVKNNKMVLFMKGTPQFPQCGFSAATVRVVESYGHPYEAVDVLADPAIRATLPEYSNWPTFPQLFVSGELVGGCDIVHDLHASGELKQMLDKAFEGAAQ